MTALLPLVLVVAADRELSEPFRHELSAAGFKAYYVQTLASALAVVSQWQFDAVLLLGRGFDGAMTRMLESLRDAAELPILLVLDDAGEERQLRVLDAGAAQVLVEPTSMRIVAAQLRRLIDLSQQRRKHESAEVRFGPLRLDPRRAAATIGHAPVALTAGEFELLLLLATHPGELVHRESIARTLGRSASAETRRSADMHVCRIRRKLRDVGGHNLQVETVYGRGYLLRMAAAEEEPEEVGVTEWSV
jgi:DNA-binding response OmpR family regulator